MYNLIANIELLFMSALLVALLFIFNMRYWKSQLINPLSLVHLMVFFGCFFEMGAFWADGKPELTWLNYASNILYLGSIGLMSMFTLEYANNHLPLPFWKIGQRRYIFLLPLVFELFVLISAPKTHLIFYVDELGYYHRAVTFFIQLIPYCYLLATTALGIHNYRNAETQKERSFALSIALFAIPPFVLGGLQLLVKANTLDILEFSVVVSLLANYAVSQNNRITTDVLTGLFNREALDVALAEEIRNNRKNEKSDLYVLMGDLDGFKSINDTYGHVEGDRALIRAADVLHRTATAYKATAARYGGDEFVIVLETMDAALPGKIINAINKDLAAVSESAPYTLSMSIGYARFRSSDTVTDLLKAADRELYEIKRIRKASR